MKRAEIKLCTSWSLCVGYFFRLLLYAVYVDISLTSKDF